MPLGPPETMTLCWHLLFQVSSTYCDESSSRQGLRALWPTSPRNWCLQPNSPQRTESCQQPLSEPGSQFHPSWTWSWTLQPLPTPWLKPCKRPCWARPSCHTICEIIYMYCLMPIILGKFVIQQQRSNMIRIRAYVLKLNRSPNVLSQYKSSCPETPSVSWSWDCLVSMRKGEKFIRLKSSFIQSWIAVSLTI